MEKLKKERKFNEFDIPGVYYFEAGNYFTGSRGNLNYKIIPGKDEEENGILTISIWHGLLCSDLVEMEETRTFALTSKGQQEMLDWLRELN
ncbi:MAG: hypothetical protein K2H29_01995 [Oscillospiraceae bacterium]|nr:hypothetical protein [Oscillospiraceae bacterium]